MTTFSISIPVYQQAEFLPTALKSLRCQAADFQLAVLDATPDDSVQQVLTPYRDLIDYSYHHADAGQSAAIVEGWQHTSGDIVTWLNADDYYFPDTLAKVAQIFTHHPEIDVVYGHSVYVTAYNTFQMYFPAIHADPALLTRSCIICQPSCFVRRRAMERVGSLNTALHYTMDWDFWLRLYQAGCSFYFLDDMLSAVLVHPATKTASGATQRYEEIHRLLTQNNSLWHSMLSMAGFRYHDILTTKQKTAHAWGYLALAKLSQLRQKFVKKTRPVIRGMECLTNLVRSGHCEILLPWYAEQPAKQIIITVDQPLDYSLTIAGKTLSLQEKDQSITDFLGKPAHSYRYQAIFDSHATPVLSLQLQSALSQPWQLLNLVIN